ncbi:MAG: DUF6034 family protein [Clostridia bacterium]|nr:DUF6034 family protein [Clostridia bacterium]
MKNLTKKLLIPMTILLLLAGCAPDTAVDGEVSTPAPVATESPVPTEEVIEPTVEPTLEPIAESPNSTPSPMEAPIDGVIKGNISPTAIGRSANAPQTWTEEFISEHNTTVTIDAELTIPEVEAAYKATARHRYFTAEETKKALELLMPEGYTLYGGIEWNGTTTPEANGGVLSFQGAGSSRFDWSSKGEEAFLSGERPIVSSWGYSRNWNILYRTYEFLEPDEAEGLNITKEQAVETAMAFIGEFGDFLPVAVNVTNNQVDGDNQSKTVKYAYIVHFCENIGGLARQELSSLYLKTSEGVLTSWNADWGYVVVDDEGIAGFMWGSALTSIETEDEKALLCDFSIIRQNALSALQNRAVYGDVTVADVTFTLAPLRDETDPLLLRLVPAWVFEGYMNYGTNRQEQYGVNALLILDAVTGETIPLD